MISSSSFDHPQSMTMQMALLPPNDPFLATARPHSNPIFPSAAKPNSSVSTPAKPSSGRLPGSPSTPSKSNKSEISSTVSTPSGKAGQEQCSGMTKAAKRCTRMVKLSAFGSDDGDSPSIPRFCHQHTKEMLSSFGFYGRKTGEWVKFEDWIPPYLQQETQASLRAEMEKARSQSDVPGYIYTYEIREGQTDTIKLKVGRAVNIIKRLDQWDKQCRSKEQVLRGYFPGTVEPDEDGNDGGLMKGRLKPGEKGACCHRLERLIHLELADLACSKAYLDPSWPEVDTPPESKASNSKELNRPAPCPDCGSLHKEVFEFQRWKKGKNVGKEWELLVKPVIERWGRFVELHV